MGKIYGINGVVRGKIGGTVYYKGADGATYARTYQPTVLNPKSDAQLVQRCKVNLAGRVSAVTPSDVLKAFGFSGRRKNRSAFVGELIKTTIVTHASGEYTAKVQPATVQFSRGTEPARAAVTTPVAVTATGMSMALTMANESLVGKYGERIVVAIMRPEDDGVFSAVLFTDVLFNNTEAKTITVPFPAGIPGGTMVSTYRIPFVLSDEGSAIATTQVHNDGTAWVSELLRSQSNLRGWGGTLHDSTSVFIQA